MTIEIKEKGSDKFYKEVINVISQYRPLLKKPRRKIKNQFRQFTVLIIACVFILLLDVVSVCLFGAGTGEKAVLFIMVFLIVLQAAFLFRLNKLKKTMLSDTRTATLTLDKNGCALRVDGKNSPLSNREYHLIELFMRNPHVYFSADALLDRVWGMDAEVEYGTVWVHISGLRKKLESLGAHVEILSKRGVGYALEEIE